MPDAASQDTGADWARSGVMALTGHPDGAPFVPPGDAVTFAARTSERMSAAADPPHALRLDGAALLSERAALTGYRRRGRVSAGGASRLLPTADGWGVVTNARPDDSSLLAALVSAELHDDPWPAVTDWLGAHAGAELAERAALLGLAATPVGHALTPTLPRPSQLRPVAGLLVVDFSALWAGPLCAHLLGLAGARIVKVETPQRPDGARRGNEAFYDLLHAGHRSVMLDPATLPGRRALSRLVEAADIVIEASRPRALAGFGLDAEAAAADGTIWVSITAAGRASPRIGFGDDVAAGAGLVAYDTDRGPVFCGDALADPLTGLVAAELAMSAPAADRGMLFDVAMSSVVAVTLARSQPRPSPAARRSGPGWVVDCASGPVTVAAPRARAPSARAASAGEHTEQVLAELQIPKP